MKRFYKQATARDGAVLLDGRPVRTPGGRALVAPARIADALAREWAAQDQAIDWQAMPLNRMVNQALDRIATDPGETVKAICKFGETDLVCYRATTPDSLVAEQARAWDPLVDWAREALDVALTVTTGVMHVAQPPGALDALRARIARHDAIALSALATMTSAAGSVIVALAVALGRLDAAAGWRAATVDERHQSERWGVDAEAQIAQSARERDFNAAAQLYALTR